MPLGRLAGGTLVATALAATMCVGTYWTAQAMQSDLVDQARTTLDAQQLTATVMFSGRDAYVWADTPSARADAIAALKTIPGVRIVLVGQGAPPVTQRPSAAVSSVTPSTTQTILPAPSATPIETASDSTTPTAAASMASEAPSSTATTTSTAVTVTPVPTASPSSIATSAPLTIPGWPAILFDGDSSTVNQGGKSQVAQIAQFMVAHPTTTVVLTGYTDTTGTAAGRQSLGMARAKAVQAMLVADGVSSSRTTVVSGGGSNPVATSGTSQGRALNRRVTVTMTQES